MDETKVQPHNTVYFDWNVEVDFLAKVHDAEYTHETKRASQFALKWREFILWERYSS